MFIFWFSDCNIVEFGGANILLRRLAEANVVLFFSSSYEIAFLGCTD